MAHAARLEPIRLAVLISGGGRTLMNFVDKIRAGELEANVVQVIASSPCSGCRRAAEAGLPVEIIDRGKFPSTEAFSDAVNEVVLSANPDLVALGGFLHLWKFPLWLDGRVMNIHPALLPGFGGSGMYGHHVHEAVLAAGCKVSGCTVHFCDHDYDRGPIILQRCVPVQEDDTPDALAARVFEQECIAYPEAVQLFAAGRLKIEGHKVRILGARA